MSTNPSKGSSIGGSLGNIVKGSFDTVQGVGNSIRGNAMDFLDSATGTGPRHQETVQGRMQTEKGVSEMSAGKHGQPQAAPATSNIATHTQTAPTATSGAAPPLPPRA